MSRLGSGWRCFVERQCDPVVHGACEWDRGSPRREGRRHREKTMFESIAGWPLDRRRTFTIAGRRLRPPRAVLAAVALAVLGLAGAAPAHAVGIGSSWYQTFGLGSLS